MFFFVFFFWLSVLTFFRSIPFPCILGILLGDWMVLEKEKQFSWIASCVPTKLRAPWRMAHYLPHTLLHSHPKNPGPAKLGRQTLLKSSLILNIHVVDSNTHPLVSAHTIAYFECCVRSYFPFTPLFFAHTNRGAQESSCHVSLLLTHRTKQFIRAWVESSLHIVLSVCSQSASLLNRGWTPLTAGRI